MSVIREMYEGKINPLEIKLPETEEFKDAIKRTMDPANRLQEALTQEQWALYEEHENARSQVEELEQEELFCMGVKIGMRLMKEAWR